MSLKCTLISKIQQNTEFIKYFTMHIIKVIDDRVKIREVDTLHPKMAVQNDDYKGCRHVCVHVWMIPVKTEKKRHMPVTALSTFKIPYFNIFLHISLSFLLLTPTSSPLLFSQQQFVFTALDWGSSRLALSDSKGKDTKNINTEYCNFQPQFKSIWEMSNWQHIYSQSFKYTFTIFFSIYFPPPTLSDPNPSVVLWVVSY